MGQQLDRTWVKGASDYDSLAAAVPILEDESSPSNPSAKSMVTPPLEKYGDYLAFWYACINLCQKPLTSPFAVRTLKSAKLLAAARSEFSVTLTEILPRCPQDLQDPGEGPSWPVATFFGVEQALMRSGMAKYFQPEMTHVGPPPTVTSVINFKVDKEKGEVLGEISNDALGEGNVEKVWMVLHRDPLVWECWSELPDRRKHRDEQLHGLVKRRLTSIVGRRTWVNPIKPVRNPCEVDVDLDAESPSDPQLRCVLTAPLDAYIDAEPLFLEWLEEIKSEAAEITRVSAHAFMATSTPLVFSWDGDDWKSTVVQFNEKTLEISEAFCDESETLQQTLRTKVWKGPLRIECWAELPGGRVSSERGSAVAYQRFQYLVRCMLKKLRDREESNG